MAALWRLVIWGGSATAALAAVAIFSISDQGTQRLAVAKAALSVQAAEDLEPTARRKVASRIAVEREARALVGKVQTLTADRDRLQARLDAVERNVEDITGSIKSRLRTEFDFNPQPTGPDAVRPPFVQVPAATARQPVAGFLPAQPPPTIQAAAQPAGAPTAAPPSRPTAAATATATAAAPPPVATAPAPAAPQAATAAAPAAAQPATATTVAAASQPAAQTVTAMPAAAPPQTTERTDDEAIQYIGIPFPAPRLAPPTVTRTQFGVDMGTAHDMDGLRALWANAQAAHGTALRSLRPLIAVRENTQTHAVELRLVAGPLTDAATAARLCATLEQQGATCRPAVYDGQHLAMR